MLLKRRLRTDKADLDDAFLNIGMSILAQFLFDSDYCILRLFIWIKRASVESGEAEKS